MQASKPAAPVAGGSGATPTIVTPELAPVYLPSSVGFNGLCLNSVGLSFLDDIDGSTCQQMITDLATAATSFLNPLTYKKEGWGFATGVKSTQLPAAVTLGDVWISTDGVLTKQTAPYTLAAPSYTSGSPCSATNVVKEVYYSLEYAPYSTSSTGFKITKATLDLVL